MARHQDAGPRDLEVQHASAARRFLLASAFKTASEVESYSDRVPYDLELAARIRALVGHDSAVTEQRMFGGLAFLVDGHMAVAAVERGGLMVRIDPSESTLLVAPHARPMEMRGRPIMGWLEVDSAGIRSERQLKKWVDVGVTFARSLPPKPGSSAPLR